MRFLLKILKYCLLICGAVCIVGLIWTAIGAPLLFDNLLIINEPPQKADYVVCVTGGTSNNYLPVDEGWQRIYTAVQIYLDGYAPKIVFSGGGSARLAEAEIYAEAAGWLGCRREDTVCEPRSASTADHPGFLMQCGLPNFSKETRLNIVTSPLHSYRTAAVFRKAGFHHFRVISSYSAQISQDPMFVRTLRTSRYAEYVPNGKKYDDLFIRLKQRTNTLFTSLREFAALISYKIKGKI